jgi:hypothetical protein
MSDLRDAARQAMDVLKCLVEAYEMQNTIRADINDAEYAITDLKAALEQPERTLTDEVIADLWHQNGGFHHHFARAIERYLKEEK